MSSVHDYLSLFLFIHSEDFADEQIMVVAFIFAAVPFFVNNIILEIPSVHAGIIELSHDKHIFRFLNAHRRPKGYGMQIGLYLFPSRPEWEPRYPISDL